MRIIHLSEAYLGTYNVECDYGGREMVHVFTNPTRTVLGKMMRDSEYTSVRASLYPDTGDLYVWEGSRVQHHDMHFALFGQAQREYIRMFFDKSGVSTHDSDGSEENTDHVVNTIQNSPHVIRLVGRDADVQVV